MTPGEFRRRYATALKVFVDDRTERSLRAAYELGRSAVAAHLGVRHIDIPITPEKVWNILREKGVAE